ncbi:MAG: type VI secretion system-associated protein TagF [Rhodospirillales bacterium]
MPALAVGEAAGPPGLGFYGKMPAVGDFVSRRIDAGFVAAWDAWMQAAIVAAREALGADWLGLYLKAPLWRFALSAGVCGPRPAAGVLMSSVDKVGRYFPLVLAAPLPDAAAVLALPVSAEPWFAAVESVALGALDDAASLDGLDGAAGAVGAPDGAAHAPAAPAGWALPLAGDRPPAAGDVARLAGAVLAGAAPDLAVWWTAGSPDFAGACVASRGLPPPRAAAAFLDGRFDRWGWTMVAAAPETAA